MYSSDTTFRHGRIYDAHDKITHPDLFFELNTYFV